METNSYPSLQVFATPAYVYVSPFKRTHEEQVMLREVITNMVNTIDNVLEDIHSEAILHSLQAFPSKDPHDGSQVALYIFTFSRMKEQERNCLLNELQYAFDGDDFYGWEDHSTDFFTQLTVYVR